jgi:hypothetical protein
VAQLRATGDERKRRKALFDALNRFILGHSGWVTSVDSAVNIRFETLPNSGLPEALAEAGYPSQPIEVVERFLPFTETLKDHSGRKVERQHLAPTMVEVWGFRLP